MFGLVFSLRLVLILDFGFNLIFQSDSGRFSFSDIFVVIGNDRTQIRMFRLFILSYFGFTHKPFCRY